MKQKSQVGNERDVGAETNTSTGEGVGILTGGRYEILNRLYGKVALGKRVEGSVLARGDVNRWRSSTATVGVYYQLHPTCLFDHFVGRSPRLSKCPLLPYFGPFTWL